MASLRRCFGINVTTVSLTVSLFGFFPQKNLHLAFIKAALDRVPTQPYVRVCRKVTEDKTSKEYTSKFFPAQVFEVRGGARNVGLNCSALLVCWFETANH